MSGFIGGICKVRMMGDKDCNDVNPSPPAPPGPLDQLIPGVLNGSEFEYTAQHPVLHCRIAGIKGANGSSTIAVTVDGSPMTLIGIDQINTSGSPFSAAFYLTGIADGEHTIAISVTGASLGNCAVRLGELVSQSGIGEILYNIGGSPSYYWEFGGSSSLGTSIHGSIVTAASEQAYAIEPSLGFDDEQWNTWQTGMTARFATGTMGGEGDGLYVYYTSNGSHTRNSGMLYEILNGVLP